MSDSRLIKVVMLAPMDSISANGRLGWRWRIMISGFRMNTAYRTSRSACDANEQQRVRHQ